VWTWLARPALPPQFSQLRSGGDGSAVGFAGKEPEVGNQETHAGTLICLIWTGIAWDSLISEVFSGTVASVSDVVGYVT
jgi:hypothetical protein